MRGRYTEAEPLYLRALAIQEKATPEHPSVAVTLNSLAKLYRQQGRFAEAESLINRALALMEKALGDTHPLVATALENLGRLLMDQARYDESERVLNRSALLRMRVLAYDNLDNAKSSIAFAELHLAKGDYMSAYLSASRAMDILEGRALSSAGQDESGSDAERQSYRSTFLFFLSLAAVNAPKPLSVRGELENRSFAAMQLAQRSSADRALAQAAFRFAVASDTLARLVRERQDMAHRVTALETEVVAFASQKPDKRDATRDQANRDNLAAARRQFNDIDAEVRRNFPAFAELTSPQPLTLAECQDLLAADEALIAFIVGGDRIYRFVVRRDGIDFVTIAAQRGAIEEAVAALRLGLDPTGVGSLAELRYFEVDKAHELYELLFATASPLLAGANHLLIVPDGVLGGLPFSVLLTKAPTAEAKREGFRRLNWLARDYAITVLPSVGSLRALRVFAAKAVQPREPFLGFGDPDLTGRPGDVKSGRNAMARLASRGPVADVTELREMPELPDTAEELRRIATSLGADPVASVNLRRDATETRVKTAPLSAYRVLAFATHGLMAGEFSGYGEPAHCCLLPRRRATRSTTGCSALRRSPSSSSTPTG